MDEVSEKPYSRNDNNLTSEIRHGGDSENHLKIAVRYHVLYPSLSSATSRWEFFLEEYKTINTELLFPQDISIRAARDYATSHFPEAFPLPDFTYALLSYVRANQRYYVLDYSADLGRFFGNGERMDVFNHPNFFDNKARQEVLMIVSGIGIVLLFVCVVTFLICHFSTGD